MEFPSSEIAAVFAAYPEDVRPRLLGLRTLIHETAAATEGVGPLTETLKWGQPAFLTEKSKSGSTIRLHTTKQPGEAAIFFICHTGLVNRFREIFPDALRYEGTRAITFRRDELVNEDALAQCLAMALTFKLRK